MTITKRVMMFCPIALAMSASCGWAAPVTTTLFSDNFDNLSDSTLQGQNGWLLNGYSNPANTGGAGDDMNVQSTVYRGASGRSVKYLYNAATPDTYWAAHAISGAATGTRMEISYWVYGDGSGRRSNVLSMSTGTNPWDASPFSVRAWAGDSTGWVEHFWYTNGGTWVDSGITMTANTWWQVRIVYDTTAAAAADYTYSVYVKLDGGQEQTVAQNIAVKSGLSDYVPKWFQLQRSYGGGTDDWFFDDVTVTSTSAPIPEPAALGILGIGMLGLMAKRDVK